MINFPLLGRAGAQRQFLMLAVELLKLGHDVEIFTNAADKQTYPELFDRLKVNVVPFQPVIPKPLTRFFKRYTAFFKNYADACPSMLALGQRIFGDFDIINNHNAPTEWAAFLAKRRLKIPIVWMCNEPLPWFWRPQERHGLEKFNWPVYELFDRYVVRQVDEILALSSFAAEIIRKVYNRPSRVVRSGVDVEFFHKAVGEEMRRKNGIDDNEIVLLQVGMFYYFKRQTDSIKALAHLSRKYDNIRLVLDGMGDPKQLRAFGKKLGVEDRIVFSYAQSDEELAQVYAACNVFLFPSENTWGLAVTEAMAAGKPVIVSNRAGASEIVQNNVNGFVVSHGDSSEIAERVELFVKGRHLTEKLGNNGYHYVKKNLSWEKYAKSMEEIFKQTINSQQR